jgi:hypothetical protein
VPQAAWAGTFASGPHVDPRMPEALCYIPAPSAHRVHPMQIHPFLESATRMTRAPDDSA